MSEEPKDTIETVSNDVTTDKLKDETKDECQYDDSRYYRCSTQDCEYTKYFVLYPGYTPESPTCSGCKKRIKKCA